MTEAIFAGDKKEGVSLLHPYEVKLKEVLLPCVPRGIETYHLTMLTIVWSILVVVFSWLATYNRQWLWGASLMVVAQYISDLLDGAIGRQRNTGLVKWGFYMDHFLDYIFLCSILIGYSLLMPNSMKYWMFFIFAIIGAFLVNSFLQFAATNKFRIAYWGIGPTEGRLGFILINTLIIFVDKAAYVKTLPYILAGATFALFFTAYNTQRQLWKIDMDAKAIAEGNNQSSSFDGQGLIIRYFLVSFVMASLAFLILVAHIGGAFYKLLAGFVYVISWLPLILAFVRYRQAGLKKLSSQRRFGPLVTAAVILICCAWAGVTLMPPVADPAVYLTPTYRTKVQQDARQVLLVQDRLQRLLTHPMLSGRTDSLEAGSLEEKALQQLCREFMGYQVTLDAIRERTKGPHLIDYQEEPGLHTDTFLVQFAAHALQSYSVITMAQQSQDKQFRAWLNEGTEHTSTFDKLVRRLITPKTLFRLGADSSYIDLLKETIETTKSSNTGDERRQLRAIALGNVDEFVKKLRDHPQILAEVRLQLSEIF